MMRPSNLSTHKQVLVIGAGGLGCPVTQALGRAGLPEVAVTLVDPDVVEPSNLHRQLWHHPEDVGRPKVTSAAEKLSRAFPSLKVEPLQGKVTAEDVDAWFGAHALVVDATDGVETKFMLADAAVRTGVPLVYGGVLRMSGQVMLLWPGGPCLRCLFEAPPPADDAPTCAQAGVLGTLPGIIGAMQAQLACDWLKGARPLARASTLHTFDGRTMRGRSVTVTRRSDCGMCEARP